VDDNIGGGRHKSLLCPAEFLFQLAVIHFNQRRTSVRTGVRH
jgi:hypothetical protein